MSEIRQSDDLKRKYFYIWSVAKKLILKMLFWPTSAPLLLAPRVVKKNKNRVILLDESNCNLSWSLLGQFQLELLQNSKMEYEKIKRLREKNILRHFQKKKPDTLIIK